MKCGLHTVFDDACPSNATLYHGHKYTLTYFFLTLYNRFRGLSNYRNLINLLVLKGKCVISDRGQHILKVMANLEFDILDF